MYWESEFPKAPGLPPVELARLHFQRIRTETGSRDAHVSVSQESLAMEASQPVGDRSEAVFEWTNSEPSPADDSLRSVLPEAVPRRRTPWLLLPTLFRALDWPLKKIAGEENAIVHNFFRLIASVVLAMLIFFVGARVGTSMDRDCCGDVGSTKRETVSGWAKNRCLCLHPSRLLMQLSCLKTTQTTLACSSS